MLLQPVQALVDQYVFQCFYPYNMFPCYQGHSYSLVWKSTLFLQFCLSNEIATNHFSDYKDLKIKMSVRNRSRVYVRSVYYGRRH